MNTKIRISKSTHTFVFGKCVQIALCEAFDEKMSVVDNLMKSTFGERDMVEGYTNGEINRVISILSKKHNISVQKCNMSIIVGTKKHTDVSPMMIAGLSSGCFIATTYQHAMYFEDGTFYDSYLLVKPDIAQDSLSCIWVINREPIKKPLPEYAEIDFTNASDNNRPAMKYDNMSQFVTANLFTNAIMCNSELNKKFKEFLNANMPDFIKAESSLTYELTNFL